MFRSAPAQTAQPFAAALFVVFLALWVRSYLLIQNDESATYGTDPEVESFLTNWLVALGGLSFVSGIIFLCSLAGARTASRVARVRPIAMVALAIAYTIAFWFAEPLFGDDDTGIVLFGASLTIVGPFVITYIATIFWVRFCSRA